MSKLVYTFRNGMKLEKYMGSLKNLMIDYPNAEIIHQETLGEYKARLKPLNDAYYKQQLNRLLP